MNYYRHYKDKPYKYVGLAKHSETQEEMVIYETLYENTGGRIWVRPKKMFFEDVEVQGKTIPRFAKVAIEYSQTSEVSDESVQIIGSIAVKCFDTWDVDWFLGTLNSHQKIRLVLSKIGATPVGFKLGYALNSQVFYSWYGAVLPSYRGLGIASELMRQQHDWCKQQGFSSIQTKTQNRFRDMLMLNIKSGFDVVGTHTDSVGLKIVLEKKLL